MPDTVRGGRLPFAAETSGPGTAPRPESLRVDVLRSGRVAVLGVAGYLTGAGGRHIRAVLQRLIAAGSREISVHLDVAGTVDASCLQILRDARSRLVADHGDLVVTSTIPTVRTMLGLTGLTDEGGLTARPVPMAGTS